MSRENWHLQKGVPLTLMFSIIVMIVSGFMAWTSLTKDVEAQDKQSNKVSLRLDRHRTRQTKTMEKATKNENLIGIILNEQKNSRQRQERMERGIDKILDKISK